MMNAYHQLLYCRPPLPLQVEGLRTLEEKAEWRAATDALRSGLSSTRSDDSISLARGEETAAYFLIRASLQAESQADFDQGIIEAEVALEKAEAQYRKSAHPDSRILIVACRAKNHFLHAWTSKIASSRPRLLFQAYSALQEVIPEFSGFDKVELQLPVLGDLLLYALEWSATLPRSDKSVSILTTLLDLVERVLQEYSSGLPEERARILCLASQISRQASFWSEGSPLEVELSKKAVRFALQSQEAKGSDPFLAAIVDILLGQSLADFESDPHREEGLWRNALNIGRDLNDRYITAWATSLLCYNAAWKLSEAEELEQASKIGEDCFRLGDEAVRNASLVRFDHVISSTYAGPISNACYLLAMEEPDRAKRRRLRDKAVESANLALETAQFSGSLLDVSNSYHSLSKSIEAACLEEPDTGLKRKALRKALSLRELALSSFRLTVPAGTWAYGVQLHYLATLLSELATLERGKARRDLLSRSLKASTECIESCSTTAAGSEGREKYGSQLARYLENHARLLERLHVETGKRAFENGALAAYRRAGQIYGERHLPAHSASTHWHAGTISHLLGAHADSSSEFSRSAEYYSKLENDTPHLAAYFHGLSTYMDAWSHVESAHEAHLKGEYAVASEEYHRASLSLQDSPRAYLTTDFLAWTSLENAEDLSRRELTEESREAFEKAAGLFDKCKNEISGRLSEIEDQEERSLAKKIGTFSESHAGYCRARSLLEQGRREELRGDYVGASRLYGQAADLIENVLGTVPEDAGSDFQLALDLARGLSVLCAARAQSSPSKYHRAATLFKAAAKDSSNLQASQYAMGNRFLSEALASETRFAASADPRFYGTAKRSLRSASICFSRSNMDHSSKAVDARLSLLDASLYATKAEASPNPRTRTQNLSLAERCLRHALQLYQNAGDQGNQREVGKLLEKVSERKRLGQVLRGTLEHAVVASPSSLLSGPAHGPETAVGLAEIEERIIQGQLSLPDQMTDAEPFTLSLDLVNVGSVPVSLLQLRDLLPASVKVMKMTSAHTIEDGSVDLGSKRLQPKAVESISLDCLSAPGLQEFKPRILYLDAEGKPRGHRVALTSRHVLSHATFEFEAPSSKAIFHFLASEFVRDYMVKHVAAEGAGWRSLPNIVGKTGLPRSAVYSPRGLGRPLAELVRRGLVEVRIFASQPGRGGRVQRARVCYETNPVRAFVDGLSMKTSENPNRTV